MKLDELLVVILIGGSLVLGGFTSGYFVGQKLERRMWVNGFKKAVADSYNDGFSDGEQNYLLHTCPRNGAC